MRLPPGRPGLRARRGGWGRGRGVRAFFLFAFSVCLFFFNQSCLCRRGWEAGCSPRGDGRGGGTAVGGERGAWVPAGSFSLAATGSASQRQQLGSPLPAPPGVPGELTKHALCARDGHTRGHRGHASRAPARACASGLVLLDRVSEDAGQSHPECEVATS